MIRLCTPLIDEDDFLAVRNVLETGYLVQGKNVSAFEDVFSHYMGSGFHSAAVSNGTAALHLALLALDIRKDDVVFVTAYSWPATANVIEVVGAHPVFVDVDPRTMNMDPEALKLAISKAKDSGLSPEKFKAVMVVHAFGLSADMDAINNTAKTHGMFVIEDAACALGSSNKDRPCGTMSDVSCFSLHPRKAITTGEGGFCVTRDESVMRRIKAFRNHGQDPNATSPDFICAGLNYRMTDFQAAMGITQMEKLNRITERRFQHAKKYNDLFAGTEILAPYIPDGLLPNYQSYVVQLPADINRNDVIALLREKEIETTTGTWHMPLIGYFREKYNYKRGDFPNTDHVFEMGLAIPLAFDMSEEQQDYVAACLRDAVDSLRETNPSRTTSMM